MSLRKRDLLLIKRKHRGKYFLLFLKFYITYILVSQNLIIIFFSELLIAQKELDTVLAEMKALQDTYASQTINWNKEKTGLQVATYVIKVLLYNPLRIKDNN